MTSTWAAEALSDDAFLGGRITILQPRQGYRAGIDPVLLAAAVPAKPGQSVLELGCGGGVALLCLGARVQGLALHGVELQSPYADLARRNATRNGQAVTVHEADLRALPAELRAVSFDHVIANPPYFDPARHSDSPDRGRGIAMAGETPLTDWIATAAKRLAPKGYLTLIQRMDRLPDLLAALAGRLGSIVVMPVAARQSSAPDLLLLQARKHGRAAFRMTVPLVLHEGDRHIADGDSYRTEVQAILRDGATIGMTR